MQNQDSVAQTITKPVKRSSKEIQCQPELNNEVTHVLKKQKRNIVIGYMFNPKKLKRIGKKFKSLPGVELKQINLDTPMEEQEPIDIVLIKVTDVLVKHVVGLHENQKLDQNFQSTDPRIQLLQKYFLAHPNVLVLDPLHKVIPLLDRKRVHDLVKHIGLKTCEGKCIRYPRSHAIVVNDCILPKDLQHLQELQFPIICKPDESCGTDYSHSFFLLSNIEQVKKFLTNGRWIAQEYINHNAQMYKVYVLGDYVQVYITPSICNLDLDHHCAFQLNTRTMNLVSLISSTESNAGKVTKIGKDVLQKRTPQIIAENIEHLSALIRTKLHLSWFGYDLIVDAKTNDLWVVDINYFPSYKFISDAEERIVDFAIKKYKENIQCNNIS